MRALISAYRLLEPRHHGLQGLLLIEPASKQVHAHKGQTRGNADHRAVIAHGDSGRHPTGAPLVRAQLPSRLPAVKMSQAHPRPNPMLSCFGEQVSAGAIGGLLEQGPKHGLIHLRELATVTSQTDGLACKSSVG